MSISIRISTLILFCFTSMLWIACDDEDPVTPDQNLRVVSMSHGESHYSLLRYDEQARVIAIVQGNVDDSQDSVETEFQVVYKDGLIEKISSNDGAHTFIYTYSNGKIIESHEYVDFRLVYSHAFIYNDESQIDIWISKQNQSGVWIPLQRKAYRYDTRGNAIVMELENYDPATKGHELISTSKFLDFDDKQNTSALFLNMYNPYFTLFKNNARTWRVENTNGTVGETQYEYGYNAEGYTTSQRDLAGNMEIKYQFEQY